MLDLEWALELELEVLAPEWVLELALEWVLELELELEELALDTETARRHK